MKLMDIILESYGDDAIVNAVKGFHLTPTKMGFGKHHYTTTKDKPSKAIVHRIQNWINKSFPNSGVIVKFDSIYSTINFHKTKIHDYGEEN